MFSSTPAGRPIRRRSLLAAGGSCLLLPRAVTAATNPSPGNDLLEDAAIWGLPLVRTGRYHALAKVRGLADNHFYLNQALATPSLKLAAPNVDTIYGFAWIDVANGPVAVQVPDAANRYYSVQFIDAYETILGYAGKGATSRGAGLYVVTGPGWTGTLPAGAKRVDSPTTLVLALTRTLVKNAADLPAAQSLQASYAIAPLSGHDAPQRGTVLKDALSVFPKLDLHEDAPGFFAQLDDLVRRFPPRGQEAAAFGRLAPLHLGDGFATRDAPPAAQQRQALQGALARIAVQARRIADTDDGWSVNYHIRPFNADPTTRAALNSVGPGAHIAEEALYFTAASDVHGAPLVGTSTYDIVFPKGGLPPAKEFWSLILYDGRTLFLVPNRLDRYTINDRTPNLSHESDGSLRIVLSHAEPTGGGNWLPAPEGPFILVLRTYQPDAALLSGAYKVPPIVRRG